MLVTYGGLFLLLLLFVPLAYQNKLLQNKVQNVDGGDGGEKKLSQTNSSICDGFFLEGCFRLVKQADGRESGRKMLAVQERQRKLQSCQGEFNKEQVG